MPRYFVEVAYKGTAYAGFQVQKNANTIQAEVEKAMAIFFRRPFELTGSSRTDAGVHARQNFFHTDIEDIDAEAERSVYHINAILPADIVMLSIKKVSEGAHCRFDAVSRSYRYTVYRDKDPFISDRAYYYPYTIDVDVLNKSAAMIMEYSDFTSFSKKRTQVTSHICDISKSIWTKEGNCLVYEVTGNRFLRGMVRGLVGTMLQAGRGKYDVELFQKILEGDAASKVDFSAPAHGLMLEKVSYGDGR